MPNSRVKAEVVFSNGLEFGDEEEFDLNGSQTDIGRMDAELMVDTNLFRIQITHHRPPV